MIQRILCPVDASENAARALAVAKEMALKHKAALVLFHAFHVPPELEGLAKHVADDGSFIEKARTKLAEEKARLVHQHKQALEADGLEVIEAQGEGAPGPAILDAAQVHDCQMIVMGRRGLGGIRRVLLGSVSDYVVHHGSLPVTVVP